MVSSNNWLYWCCNEMKPTSDIFSYYSIYPLMVGFFAVFAAAFTDAWGSPGQAPIMYDIYSWCSYAFYGVVVFSIILGMTSSETED